MCGAAACSPSIFITGRLSALTRPLHPSPSLPGTPGEGGWGGEGWGEHLTSQHTHRYIHTNTHKRPAESRSNSERTSESTLLKLFESNGGETCRSQHTGQQGASINTEAVDQYRPQRWLPASGRCH